LTNVGGTLFFSANSTGLSHQLWKSDGTTAGTVAVVAGGGNSSPQELTSAGSTLYFTAHTLSAGYELWKSDGSAAGTVMVKDIHAGASASDPHFLTSIGGYLYFAADDGASGIELWQSDGTTTGTVLIDIAMGSGGSKPDFMAAYNGNLVVAATTETYGRELWIGELPSIPGDYNADDRVNGDDFLLWQRQLGLPAVPAGSGADGDGDGFVDGDDLGILRGKFGAPWESSTAVASAAALPIIADEGEVASGSVATNDNGAKAISSAATIDAIFASGDFSGFYSAKSDIWQPRRGRRR
jgi:ELWxxDGT repeat protein